MANAMLASIAELDDRMVVFINSYMHRSPQFDHFLAWAMNAPVIKFLPIVLAICWVWFSGATGESGRRKILAGVLVGLAALFLTRVMATALPFRTRPYTNPDLHFVTDMVGAMRTWSSFPSDHAGLAFALAATLFRASPLLGIWAFIHSILFVCFPRFYFGMHYPSDLLAGALVGLLSIVLYAKLDPQGRMVKPLLAIERAIPKFFYTAGFFLLFEIAEMFDSLRLVASALFKSLGH